ncbi:Rha family transcriptional regulator [Clostridium cochlearium]|uniref:Rha family transcriptional regulator n=1 Tax=Clostridium cochlearium TaxID=1494 RepID=UPI001797388E|nr:Rha family transcriptional regulator [Clostridium cochlearium]NMA58629.1 Rha family transcriptional regulator [Clostridium cochlearium]
MIKNMSGNNFLVVSSRELAHNFQKKHDDILNIIDGEDINGIHTTGLYKNIQRIENPLSFFIPSKYIDLDGIKKKEYFITKNGLFLLIMSTSFISLKWKIKYIRSFDAAEKVINTNSRKNLEDMLEDSFREKTKNINIMGNDRKKLNSIIAKYARNNKIPYSRAWYDFKKFFNRAFNVNIESKKLNYQNKYSKHKKITLPAFLEKSGEIKNALLVAQQMVLPHNNQ